MATNVIDNSRQKIVFGDELAATAASTKFCYGLRMDSKNEGVSDITVAKDLRIELLRAQMLTVFMEPLKLQGITHLQLTVKVISKP